MNKTNKVTSARGYGKYDEMSGEFHFQPSGKGEPVQKNVQKKGRSKLYETEGEKEASVVAHLVASKDSADPVADMYDDFRKLVKDRMAQLPPMPAGRKLLETPSVTIVADERERRVTVVSRLTFDEAYKPAKPIALLTYNIEHCFAENYKIFNK